MSTPPLPSPQRILNYSERGQHKRRGLQHNSEQTQHKQITPLSTRSDRVGRLPCLQPPPNPKNPRYLGKESSTNESVCSTIRHKQMTSVSLPSAGGWGWGGDHASKLRDVFKISSTFISTHLPLTAHNFINSTTAVMFNERISFLNVCNFNLTNVFRLSLYSHHSVARYGKDYMMQHTRDHIADNMMRHYR